MRNGRRGFVKMSNKRQGLLRRGSIELTGRRSERSPEVNLL